MKRLDEELAFLDRQSDIIEFYSDAHILNGANLSQVLQWDDEEWETNHEFIQWLFPLISPSNFNPDAPRLTTLDIEYFHNYKFRDRIHHAFVRFCGFLGLSADIHASDEDFVRLPEINQPTDVYNYKVIVQKASWFLEKEKIWAYPNHNWLRITRVLASLKLLGLDKESQAFFDCICKLYNEGYGTEESFGYWQKAAEGKIK